MRATVLSYPTDLSDAQWELFSDLLPPAFIGGTTAPSISASQAVVNAILYLVAAGCAWRLLPHDFPHWKTVYHYFRQWRWDGTWERIHQRLVEWVRVMTICDKLRKSANCQGGRSKKVK